ARAPRGCGHGRVPRGRHLRRAPCTRRGAVIVGLGNTRRRPRGRRATEHARDDDRVAELVDRTARSTRGPRDAPAGQSARSLVAARCWVASNSMELMIEGLPLWIAATNAWIVAPNGPGGECVLI